MINNLSPSVTLVKTKELYTDFKTKLPELENFLGNLD